MKAFPKSFIISVYVYFMLNTFKTSLYIHHPLEIWVQDQKISDYLRHPVKSEEVSSKVCPLGNIVGKLLGLFFILRNFLKKRLNYNLSTIIWILTLLGSLIMNLNVFVYLLPAYLLDISC